MTPYKKILLLHNKIFLYGVIYKENKKALVIM